MVNVAVPVLAESPAIAMFCTVFQLAGMKVRLAPEPTARPLLPGHLTVPRSQSTAVVLVARLPIP